MSIKGMCPAIVLLNLGNNEWEAIKIKVSYDVNGDLCQSDKFTAHILDIVMCEFPRIYDKFSIMCDTRISRKFIQPGDAIQLRSTTFGVTKVAPKNPSQFLNWLDKESNDIPDNEFVDLHTGEVISFDLIFNEC